VTNPVVARKLRIPNTPSMPVERLDARLDDVWRRHRLALVVAPAGSGKTTLLTRLATRAPGPVGWYRAEGWDHDEQALLRHVGAALGGALALAETAWRSVEEAANALEAWAGKSALLIVDDVHTLQGTAAEAALERLIDYSPDTIRFAMASRAPPAFNLPRLRVSGDLLELTGDDLRLRSWEVERLFRDFYDEPLPPEELARLARRTEGWAAGLQLFHLATQGRPAEERRHVLAQLSGSARLTREYLARNVLHTLPDELRRFLVDTSVLGRLTGQLCDRLLGRVGSAEVLADLERRRLFTQSLAEEGVFRYHEILRAYLHAALLEELGEDGLHARFSAAGNLLADAGAVTEALEAYCRGEDWEGARRLLAGRGQLVAEQPNEWVESLPQTIVAHDPWLLLASARRQRAEGRLRQAVERYELAERAFGGSDAAATCRDERLALLAWLGESSGSRPEPPALLRAALRGSPAGAAAEAQRLATPSALLVAGLARILAGEPAAARRDLLHLAERTAAPAYIGIVASLGAGVAGALMGQPHASLEIAGAAEAAEAAGLEWLARVGRASIALSGSADAVREARDVAVACGSLGDGWGEAIARLAMSWGMLRGAGPGTLPRDLPDLLRAVNAPVLEAWARGMLALGDVRAGEPDARDEAVSAIALARSVGAPGASLLAQLALAEAADDPSESAEHRDLALALAHETGLDAPSGTYSRTSVQTGARPGSEGRGALSLRLLGGFALRLDGRSVNLSSVRPRVRTLLRLLAVDAGRLVHHETIEAALWPDGDPISSARNLHVAIAALRRAVEPAAGRGSFQLIRREGDAYVLTLPPGSDVDVQTFASVIGGADQARLRGDKHVAAALYEQALDLYRGDLLPEDGPAEWVIERREALRVTAVEAARELAEVVLSSGDAPRAARACALGLRIDRYHDPLWRLLIQARDQAGDQGAAEAARIGYDRMLSELGVPSAVTGNSLGN
jgi:DNA-binding SARP family transcriptional activator